MNQAPQEQQQARPAAVAQEFMKRADMKGGEVEAYAQTFNWLQALVDGDVITVTKEHFEAMTEELKEFRDTADGADEVPVLDDLPILEPEDLPAEELDAVGSESEQTE